MMTSSEHLRYQELIANGAWAALALHIVFLVFFAWARLDALALFNLGSVAFYAVMLLLAKRGRLTEVLLLTTVEVVLHAWLALSALGFESGFEYYVFAMVPPAFFHPGWRLHAKIGYLLALSVAYIALDLSLGTHPARTGLSEETLGYVRYFNTFAAFGFVAYVTHFYAWVARKAEAELAHLATIDPLTGLFNRRHMLRMVDLELARLNRSGKAAAIVLVDIDDFKSVNDGFGHDCGDAALKTIADSLRRVMRGQDHVARWGGEEFLMLLPETDLEGARTLAEKLRAQVDATPIIANGQPLQLTLTAAVTAFGPGDSFTRKLSEVDHALLQGKREGKNRVVVAAAQPAPGVPAPSGAP